MRNEVNVKLINKWFNINFWRIIEIAVTLLGTGASQTGFGRTGTVNWQTTKKDNIYSSRRRGIFYDTQAIGAFTMNLTSSPNAGAIVSISDYARKFCNT